MIQPIIHELLNHTFQTQTSIAYGLPHEIMSTKNNKRPYAVVTASSAGIGKAIAIYLINNEWNVCLLARSVDKLTAIAKQYKSTNTNIKTIQCDVTKPEQVISACKEIKTWSNDNLNLLVNNAGGNPDSAWAVPFRTLSCKGWDDTFNLNLRSAFLFTQQLISSLINASKNACSYNGDIYDGSVINISSATSTDASWTNSIAYSVAKAGMNQLTRLNAYEFSEYKVRVNSLKLGFIPSDFLTSRGMTKKESDETLDQFIDCHMMGRKGDYNDINEMVNFLSMRNKSGWMTGHNIELNGGWCLHGSLPRVSSKL